MYSDRIKEDMKNEVIFSTLLHPPYHVVRGKRKTEFSREMNGRQGKIEEFVRIRKKPFLHY
jgi:hypothetical protein